MHNSWKAISILSSLWRNSEGGGTHTTRVIHCTADFDTGTGFWKAWGWKRRVQLYPVVQGLPLFQASVLEFLWSFCLESKELRHKVNLKLHLCICGRRVSEWERHITVVVTFHVDCGGCFLIHVTGIIFCWRTRGYHFSQFNGRWLFWLYSDYLTFLFFSDPSILLK